MKDKIHDILVKSGYNDKRSNKLELEDFLAILKAFNEEGIHFS